MEYEDTRKVAFFAIAIWPIGVPVLYALLLWASHNSSGALGATSLRTATALLSADYKPETYYWEPLEMCRKLALTGWVLLIGEDYEQARVLVALLVSVSFMAIHLAIKPLKR
eukprot:5511682-Prymnesium_polylepis.1